MLALRGVVQLLRQTLNEEKEADEKLTEISVELLATVEPEEEEMEEHAETVRHGAGKSRS